MLNTDHDLIAEKELAVCLAVEKHCRFALEGCCVLWALQVGGVWSLVVFFCCACEEPTGTAAEVPVAHCGMLGIVLIAICLRDSAHCARFTATLHHAKNCLNVNCISNEYNKEMCMNVAVSAILPVIKV